MWEELIKDEIWFTNKFIDEKYIDRILDTVYKSDSKVLDGNEQPHIISESYYNYNHIKYNIREDSEILTRVLSKLNELLEQIYKPIKPADIDNKNVLQFTTKTFNPKSVYHVHTERRDIYGDFVFINYLTTEQGGELVFPDKDLLSKHFLEFPNEKTNWERYKERLKEDKQPHYLVGPLVIKPKRNTCIVMRVGSAHFVNPVKNAKPGCRVVVTGWPYANNKWRDLQKRNLRSPANSS
jgi:hypothetical protein